MCLAASVPVRNNMPLCLVTDRSRMTTHPCLMMLDVVAHRPVVRLESDYTSAAMTKTHAHPEGLSSQSLYAETA